MEPNTTCPRCEELGLPLTRKMYTKLGPLDKKFRCGEHYRERRNNQRDKARANRIEKTYGITKDEYWEIYKWQGGHCFICQKATGKTKALAVDHDHAIEDQGWRSVRALLCGPCNQMIGFLGPDALVRAIYVLTKRPAQEVLKTMRGESL